MVADQGRILIPFSAAETRALGSPDKIVAMRYEVERRPAGGGQRTVLDVARLQHVIAAACAGLSAD
ncbi:hypothetical protein EOM89_14720, partial [Candidatus Falkowbacteria bacterium]|nr:hypothetical protein [Candidatus Falkowbacteria bacterium]